jgi:beta-lactam-binding protein with PASTA domain
MQKKKPPKWWLYAVIAGVLILAGVGAYFLLGGGVKIPDVAGKTDEEAKQTLEDAGFVVDPEVVERDAPNGSVVGTDPEADSKAGEGSTVQLLISTGPAIPPVADLSVTDAQALLSGLGFEVTTVDEVSEDSPGSVIRSAPAEGGRAAPGQSVILVVASQPPSQPVEIPPVVGDLIGVALDKLQTAKLEVLTQCVELPFVLINGEVFNQIPPGGSLGEEGDTVAVQYRDTNCHRLFVDDLLLTDAAVKVTAIGVGP